MASTRDSTPHSGSSNGPSNGKTPALSAGVIPVLRDEHLYLLLRAYRYWDFPKGIVEAGEDPLQAATRELLEESGLKNPRFRWGRDFIETERYSYGKVARYYVGEVASEKISIIENPVSGRREHDEFRWVTYDEASKLIVPRVRRVLDWAEAKISGRDLAGVHFPL
jgi:8-oxo-dGTP pyrophosphatase MutT (NUDIX family)